MGAFFNAILHAQPEFSFHVIFNNTFRQGFAAREFINLGNRLAIRHPFVPQVLGLVIVDVMALVTLSNWLMPGSPRASRFFKCVPGPMY